MVKIKSKLNAAHHLVEVLPTILGHESKSTQHSVSVVVEIRVAIVWVRAHRETGVVGRALAVKRL